MKRRLVQQSLELATEIHELTKQLSEKDADISEPINTLSLETQSHLVRGQKQEAEELKESLESAQTSLSKLEEKLLETVKLRKLRKMTINPVLAHMSDLNAEIAAMSSQIRI
ncbi:MAG TPA: hypothetical protein VLZ33_01000 [Dysgonamonadaceae bacterium]|nr:hypothetical protein [Dysgonamonadaceae bacterium]